MASIIGRRNNGTTDGAEVSLLHYVINVSVILRTTSLCLHVSLFLECSISELGPRFELGANYGLLCSFPTTLCFLTVAMRPFSDSQVLQLTTAPHNALNNSI